MNDAGSNLDQDGSSSFLQTLKIFAVGLASALHTRLDLFVTELEEERERLKQALILVVLVIFGLAFGFALINIFLVALFGSMVGSRPSAFSRSCTLSSLSAPRSNCAALSCAVPGYFPPPSVSWARIVSC